MRSFARRRPHAQPQRAATWPQPPQPALVTASMLATRLSPAGERAARSRRCARAPFGMLAARLRAAAAAGRAAAGHQRAQPAAGACVAGSRVAAGRHVRCAVLCSPRAAPLRAGAARRRPPARAAQRRGAPPPKLPPPSAADSHGRRYRQRQPATRLARRRRRQPATRLARWRRRLRHGQPRRRLPQPARQLAGAQLQRRDQPQARCVPATAQLRSPSRGQRPDACPRLDCRPACTARC